MSQPDRAEFNGTFKILDTDDEQRVVTMWGYVCRDVANKLVPADRTTDDGTVVDHSGEVIDVYDVEKAVHEYVEESREGDVMHEGDPVLSLVGALTFTPEIKKTIVPGGLPDDFPEGVILQYRVNDDEAWKQVKSGKLPMGSLAGTCTKVPL